MILKIASFLLYIIFLIGAYDDEEAAARAYDLAALKYWGSETILNFPVINISLLNFTKYHNQYIFLIKLFSIINMI